VASEALAAILPLALGHDQEAFACPWVRLTGRTAEYPSRKAQAALAVANGAVPVTPDLVDLLFRCDDCDRCLAASILPGPPDLARALWEVRASLVAMGAVPEIALLAENQQRFGNLYGDVSQMVARFGGNGSHVGVLFVPGAATLFFTPDTAVAALTAVRTIEGGADVRADCLDSGQTLRELGLVAQAAEVRDSLRQNVEEWGYRLVVAGTPKEAFGLREALAGVPVDVQYAGAVIARAASEPGFGLVEGTVVFHPSEMLLHRIDRVDEIDEWLACRLGDRYRRDPDPRQNAWPAAVERPVVRTPESLTRALAKQRLAQLQALAGETPSGDRLVILTCDPFSWQALRAVTPPTVEVVDLIVFAAMLAAEGVRVQ
jgi:hypothetical protein